VVVCMPLSQFARLYFCTLRTERGEIYVQLFSTADKTRSEGSFHLERGPGGAYSFGFVDRTESGHPHSFSLAVHCSTSCLAWCHGPRQLFSAPSAEQMNKWMFALEAEGQRLNAIRSGFSATADLAAQSCSNEDLLSHKPTLIVLDALGTIGAATVASLADYAAAFNVLAGVADVSCPRCASLVACEKTRLIQADMSRPGTLYTALTGAAVAFIAAPDQAEPTALAIAGIRACKDAGVGHVVVQSVCTVAKPGTIFADQLLPVEQYVRSCGIPYTIVRLPPLLLDDVLTKVHRVAGLYPTLTLPLERHLAHNSAAVGDLGDAVATIMVQPEPHAHKTLTLSGTPVMGTQLTAALSEAMAERVHYFNVNFEAFRGAEMVAGVPEWQVDGVIEVYKMIAQEEPCLISAESNLPAILKRAPATPDALLSTVVPTQQIAFWQLFLYPGTQPTALQCNILRLLDRGEEAEAVNCIDDNPEVRRHAVNFSVSVIVTKYCLRCRTG
jgi:uncharacterized protein YbjT (DUF2867 family)